MAKPDSALLTRKRETPLHWEVLLVIVLVLSLVLGRVLSPVFLTGANITNVLADLTEIALDGLADDADHRRRRNRSVGGVGARAHPVR